MLVHPSPGPCTWVPEKCARARERDEAFEPLAKYPRKTMDSTLCSKHVEESMPHGAYFGAYLFFWHGVVGEEVKALSFQLFCDHSFGSAMKILVTTRVAGTLFLSML